MFRFEVKIDSEGHIDDQTKRSMLLVKDRVEELLRPTISVMREENAEVTIYIGTDMIPRLMTRGVSPQLMDKINYFLGRDPV